MSVEEQPPMIREVRVIVVMGDGTRRDVTVLDVEADTFHFGMGVSARLDRNTMFELTPHDRTVQLSLQAAGKPDPRAPREVPT